MKPIGHQDNRMHWNSLKWVKLRILMASMGFVLFLGLLLFRSYQLQISENSRVHNLALQQYRATLPVQPKRGTIYDRHGQVLAMDVQVASIALHPHLIQNKESTAATLAQELKIPSAKILEKLSSKRKFEWMARRIPTDRGEALEKLKIKGVSVVPEYRRYYPNKEVAGNLLGAVGYDAKALGGLELALDKYLKSGPAEFEAQRDARGRVYTLLSEEQSYHDVTLTIDKNIQYIAEKHLWETGKKYNAKSGFSVVLNPKTGEILAMANYPYFNPNTYWDYPQANWKNHAIIDSFEPGSTFKSVIAAAALRSGIVKPKDMFFCENGNYTIGRRTIHDHEPYGNLSFSEIMMVSSNIGVTKILHKVGRDEFHGMIQDLGFSQKVGLGLPGEEKGFVSNPKKWTPIDESNIAFGQGLTVTGVQMAQAYATFANDGVLMKPYLISKVATSHGQPVVSRSPEPLKAIMNKGAARDLTRMLEGVMDDGGTGKAAVIPGYKVAGKTGTAQKVNPETRTYDPDHFVSSFIGYVPTDDPQYVIYVVYDSPRPVYYGGVVAAPVFKLIGQETLAYSGIAPRELQVAQVQKKNLKLHEPGDGH